MNAPTCKPAEILSPHHVAMLRASGLSDASIAERGYSTAMFKNALTAAGFSPGQARNVPALLIPIYDVAGALRMHQMRPDTAPVRDGKEVRYMTPAGGQLCLDVPRSVRSYLADASIPLWITEGSKKVDAGAQRGLCIIGALGVTGWMRDHAPLPDWQHIALQGRTVYIAFDADAQRKRPVWMALRSLKSFLEGQGARPLIVYLPDDPNTPDKKIGMDDFLAGGGTVDDLRGMASDTLCPCPTGADNAPRNPLEQLRFDALTSKLRGMADIHAHGGLCVSKEATLLELGKAARSVCFFYARIDDLKKWDLIDLWIAMEPHIPYGQAGAYKKQYFGRFAAQLSNWISKVGAFAYDPTSRRPHLSFWLHEYVRDLSPDQQTTVFDTFEAEGRLSQTEVKRIVDALRGPQHAKDNEPPTGANSASSSLIAGHWQRLAQHLPESVAEAELRLLRQCGPERATRVLLAAVETELSRADEPDAWDGWDVLDVSPVAGPKTDYILADADAPAIKSEAGTSRQTSRRVFTTVKTDAEENQDYTLPWLPPNDAAASTFHTVLEEEGEKITPITETLALPKAAETYAALIARAQAGMLPMPDEPIRLNDYTTIPDVNKAVVLAAQRGDTVLLNKIAQMLRE